MTTESEKFLNLFEARFYEFGRRIADFESHKEEFKKLNAQTQDVIGKFTKFVEDQRSKECDTKSKSDSLDKHLVYLGDRIVDSLAKISELHNLREKSNTEHDNLKKLVMQLQDRQAETERKVSSLTSSYTELQNKLHSLESHLQKLQNQLAAVREEGSECTTKHERLQRDISGLNVAIQSNVNECKSVFESVKNFDDKLADKIKAFSLSIEDRLREVPSLINKKFDSIQVPDVSNFAERESITRLEREFQFVSLDAKNAFLKSNNTEMEQQLLKKKIENIQILLKSFEYSNGK